MRISIAMALLVVVAVSRVVAGDGGLDPGSKTFLQQIAAVQFDVSADPAVFLSDNEPGRDYFFDAHALKHKPWFKPLVITYWVYAAVRSYGRDSEVKLKSYLGNEPNVNASFATVNGNRTMIVPSKFPVILFPWGTGHRIDRLVVIQVTGGGGAISYAFTIGPRPISFSKVSKKKEDNRN